MAGLDDLFARLKDDHVIHAIRIVRAGLHGFADLQVRGAFQLSTPVDASFLLLVDALHNALTTLGKQKA